MMLNFLNFFYKMLLVKLQRRFNSFAPFTSSKFTFADSSKTYGNIESNADVKMIKGRKNFGERKNLGSGLKCRGREKKRKKRKKIALE